MGLHRPVVRLHTACQASPDGVPRLHLDTHLGMSIAGRSSMRTVAEPTWEVGPHTLVLLLARFATKRDNIYCLDTFYETLVILLNLLRIRMLGLASVLNKQSYIINYEIYTYY